MVGGFGFLLIVIMIIRHVGACIREDSWNRKARNDALNNGGGFGGTYISFEGGHRIASNNHQAFSGRDEIKGRYVEDVVTH